MKECSGDRCPGRWVRWCWPCPRGRGPVARTGRSPGRAMALRSWRWVGGMWQRSSRARPAARGRRPGRVRGTTPGRGRCWPACKALGWPAAGAASHPRRRCRRVPATLRAAGRQRSGQAGPLTSVRLNSRPPVRSVMPAGDPLSNAGSPRRPGGLTFFWRADPAGLGGGDGRADQDGAPTGDRGRPQRSLRRSTQPGPWWRTVQMLGRRRLCCGRPAPSSPLDRTA